MKKLLIAMMILASTTNVFAEDVLTDEQKTEIQTMIDEATGTTVEQRHEKMNELKLAIAEMAPQAKEVALEKMTVALEKMSVALDNAQQTRTQMQENMALKKEDMAAKREEMALVRVQKQEQRQAAQEQMQLQRQQHQQNRAEGVNRSMNTSTSGSSNPLRGM